jgi:hypothetical protein
MSKNIDHFIFVSGFGAGKTHPAGRIITNRVRHMTHGRVTVHVATTCEQFDSIVIPHSLTRQAEALAALILGLRGTVAIFAHSQGGIPAAMVLDYLSPTQLSPANVIFAGTPIDSQLSLQRTKQRITGNVDSEMYVRTKLPHITIAGVVKNKPRYKRTPPRYVAVTPDHIASYPTTVDHLKRLQGLTSSTFIVSGGEEVTDCTQATLATHFTDRRVTANIANSTANTLILPEATHNLKGYCETAVMQIIAQRLLGDSK